jgi:uncharacterized protein YukE
MSEEKDVMVHPSMDQMAQAFQQAMQDLDNTIKEMKKQAQTMEDGALNGLGGDAFRDAINTKLIKRLDVLKAKMGELQGDVRKAQAANRQAEEKARQQFV